MPPAEKVNLSIRYGVKPLPSQLRLLPKTLQTPLADTLHGKTMTGAGAGAEQTSKAIEEERQKGSPCRGVLSLFVVAAARPLCEQTKTQIRILLLLLILLFLLIPLLCFVQSACSPSTVAHSNLCRSWVICSTRSFRVLHAGVAQICDTAAQTDTLLSNRRALRLLPLMLLFPSYSPPSLRACHLASWCEHMPGACGTVPRPQSTIHLQPFVEPLTLPTPSHLPPCPHSFWVCDFYLFIFVFRRFRSTFLMPVKHENAFAIHTQIPPRLLSPHTTPHYYSILVLLGLSCPLTGPTKPCSPHGYSDGDSRHLLECNEFLTI